jgi:hypothetical protein
MSPEQITLADNVAALLNLQLAPGYEDHWSRIFALPDGGRLYISAGRQREQLHISTSVADSLREHRPYYRDGEAPKTSINVSDSKPAERIAADIRRRLLPEYEKEAAACAAQKSRHDEYNTRRILALTLVAVPFGEDVRCDERTGEPRPLSIDREGRFSLQAKPCCDGVKLEIDATQDTAAKVAMLLATL